MIASLLDDQREPDTLVYIVKAVISVVFLLDQQIFRPAKTSETPYVYTLKHKPIFRLTSDCVEGRLGPLLEALSEL